MHSINTSKGKINFSQSLCNAILDGRAFLKGYGNELTITINAALLHGDLHVYYNNMPEYLKAADSNYANVVVIVHNNSIKLVHKGETITVEDTFF